MEKKKDLTATNNDEQRAVHIIGRRKGGGGFSVCRPRAAIETQWPVCWSSRTRVTGRFSSRLVSCVLLQCD